MLKAVLEKWHNREEWYDSVEEIKEKQDKLENEIIWAVVEEKEKAASDALKKMEEKMAQIDEVCDCH